MSDSEPRLGTKDGAADRTVQKIVSDAAAYNTSRQGGGYGFAGDPLRPTSGKYYGYLLRAGLY